MVNRVSTISKLFNIGNVRNLLSLLLVTLLVVTLLVVTLLVVTLLVVTADISYLGNNCQTIIYIHSQLTVRAA